MSDYPSESSLVVNATQQQLSQSPFTAGVAISPSQRDEAERGYDIAFETASRLELQYKAVYSEIKKRSFTDRYTQDAVKFPFNGSQAKTLLGRQTVSGTAFYALPVIIEVSDLGDILCRTVFLDVRGLRSLPKSPHNLSEYTAFWVPVQNKSGENNPKPTFSGLYLKDGEEKRHSKPRAYHPIEGKYIYSWREMKILTSSSFAGVPLRINDEHEVKSGYRKLLSFEQQLMESQLRNLFPDDLEPEHWAYDDYVSPTIREISQQSIKAGETIAEDRSNRDDLPSEAQEMLSNHQYLLEQEFDNERRQDEVKAALINRSSGNEADIDYDGLDPSQGSRYRQYRFLTSGEGTDKNLTANVTP